MLKSLGVSGHVRSRQRTEICNFGAPSPVDFFEFSTVDLFLFLGEEKSERAKGAAKASCGETVVRKGVFGESVSSLPPY